MTDLDLISIRRKRRQEKRCLACGVPTPRAALCVGCRQSLRYCPRCEDVYPAANASQRSDTDGRSTAYCVPCGNAVRNHRGRTRAEYLTEQRAHEHPQLARIKKLYKQGLTYDQIASALDMPRGTLSAVITHARETGRWSARLSRGKGWRKGAIP